MTYSINIRQDKRTGEFIAVYPDVLENRHGERYYEAYALIGEHFEASPEYITKCTKTVTEYPQELKRAIDSRNGRILITVPRLNGRVRKN